MQLMCKDGSPTSTALKTRKAVWRYSKGMSPEKKVYLFYSQETKMFIVTFLIDDVRQYTDEKKHCDSAKTLFRSIKRKIDKRMI